MALVSKPFADIITFTRASTATYFDATGTLQSAAIDAPRFDYDPATLAARGFLIEEARTNLMLYSEQFDNASGWTSTRASVSANATTAPTGTSVADKIVEDTTASNTHLMFSANVTVATATIYTYSLYAKAAGRTWFNMQIETGSGAYGATVPFCYFNLSGAGSVGTSTSATGSITSVGNGWYRCVLVAVATTSASTTNMRIKLATGDGGEIYTGDGTSGIFVFGAQLEAGSFSTSYVPTTTTALTRSADVASVNTLSPWFNATEGTLYVQFFNASDVLAQRFAAINDGTGNNSIEVISSGTGVGPYGFVQSGGSGQTPGPSPSSSITANTLYKTAIAYATNNAAGFVNGTQNVIDTASVVVPTGLTKLQIGAQTSLTNWSNAWIQRVTYYPRRLSQAEGEALTA